MPQLATRERRKLPRKSYTVGRKHTRLFDNYGRIGGHDLCDCGDNTCPGCHFPCSKCGSLKCATECRVNRKWAYTKYEVEGTAS